MGWMRRCERLAEHTRGLSEPVGTGLLGALYKSPFSDSAWALVFGGSVAKSGSMGPL